MSEQGYIVEIAEGGPWLAQDLTVTANVEEAGTWPTQEAAEKAMRDSLQL